MLQETLQSPCRVREGFGKAAQQSPACSQHLKQQEVPGLLGIPNPAGQEICVPVGNFMVPFAELRS